MYMTIFLTKTLDFRNKFLLETFASHPITVFFEILGGRMHGPSPPQILREPTPIPSKSPPVRKALCHVSWYVNTCIGLLPLGLIFFIVVLLMMMLRTQFHVVVIVTLTDIRLHNVLWS